MAEFSLSLDREQAVGFEGVEKSQVRSLIEIRGRGHGNDYREHTLLFICNGVLEWSNVVTTGWENAIVRWSGGVLEISGLRLTGATGGVFHFSGWLVDAPGVGNCMVRMFISTVFDENTMRWERLYEVDGAPAFIG